MPWYAYVETFYDPLPAGWHGGAYTEYRQKMNHKQLAAWAGGALAWSQANCKAAVKAAGGTWNQKKWKRARPTCTQNEPPAGTPVYRPAGDVLSAIEKAEDGGSGEGEDEDVVEEESDDPAPAEESK